MRIITVIVGSFFHFCFLAIPSMAQDSNSSANNSVFIRNVNYVDVINDIEIYNKDILIIDGIIERISSNMNAPDNTKIIDGTDQWLLPGLIDAHIHLFQSGGLYTRPDAIDLRDIYSYILETEWLLDNASQILQSYLRLGVTTVVDVGGPMSNYAIREEFHDSPVHPNLFVTGPLISTYQPEELSVRDPPILKVKSKEEAKELVRMQLPFEPDFIKIWYIALPTLSASSTYELVEAAVQESHKHGLKVAIHATQLNTAKLAIKAGADILVHSVANPIDEEFIEMLNSNAVYYIPTLNVHKNYDIVFANKKKLTDTDLEIVSPFILKSIINVGHIEHPNLSEAQKYAEPMLARINQQDNVRSNNLKILSAEDALIVSGTDAGNIGTLHASSYHKELRSMQLAGMTNQEIVTASTITAAKSIGVDGQIGSIEIGKKADLLLIRDSPYNDLNALSNIRFIFKNGNLIQEATLVSESPEELVQKQLNAYNLRNLDAFLIPYSDSVKVYQFPNKFLYQGKDVMKENYSDFFITTPDLHCTLKNRIVLGNTVVDQEVVSGLANNQKINAIAIYKIKHSKIQEVYFDDGR